MDRVKDAENPLEPQKQHSNEYIKKKREEDNIIRILNLLKRIREGDTEAYEKLYYTLSPPIFNLFRRLLPTTEDAEDAIQDIFIKLWNNREKIDVTRDIRPLLFLMAKQATASYYRKVRNRDGYLADYECKTEISHTTLDDMIATETELYTRIIIQRMPAQRREIYTLWFDKNMSNSEIAKKLGLKPEVVNKQLYHAREQLKKGMFLFLFGFLFPM